MALGQRQKNKRKKIIENIAKTNVIATEMTSPLLIHEIIKQAEAEVVPSSSQVEFKLKLGWVKLSWVEISYGMLS